MIQERMEEYFQNYYSLCRRVAYSYLKNYADAEDIAQEALLRLLLHQPQFDGKAHEKAWITRTAINLCKDQLKSKWHKTMAKQMEEPEFCGGDVSFPSMEADDTIWALMELPERYRNCLYLFYYEDYSIREIAEVLEKPENTVKTNLSRGRKALKEKLLERRTV